MSTENDVARSLRSWLREERHEDADRVLDVVFDQVPATPQRRAGWLARRSPLMSNTVRILIAAAAAVVIVVVGLQFIGNSNTGGPGPTPTPEATSTPAAAASEPAPSAWAGLPAGPFVVTSADDPVQVTVNIATPGWGWLTEFDAVNKDDDGLDAPETVGAVLLAWAWPAGTGINVYGDPCHWTTTTPETPATTPDEIAAAFAAQASTDATAPVDVTVAGFAGKAITLHVPMAFDIPNATREEKFADCDNDNFAFYGIEGETGDARNAQGAGQIDELWILDVNGAILILDAGYSPSTPASLVDEMRAMAESATFEAP